MSSRPLRRGLTPRIVLIAALSAGLGLVLMYLALTRIVSERVFGLASDTIVAVMQVQDGLGCRRDPEGWGFELGEGTRIDALDVATGRSANPASPPLQDWVVEALRRGERRVFPSPLFAGQGAVVAVQVAESGPCSLVRLQRAADPGLTWQGVLTLSSFLLLALVLTGVLGMLWVVRPLLRRIGRLATVAGSVGEAGSFPAGAPVSRDELGQIERGLQQAHERILASHAELEAKNQALTRHLADVAHDLLTPISSLQLALERLAKDAPAGAREALTAAFDDAVYLEQLTDNLRLATKLEEGLLDAAPPQRCDLVEVLHRVCARFDLLARHKQLSLETAHPDGEVWVAGDPLLAERALSNLVHNAIRYGELGGHVAVLLEASEERFRLEVLDDGPGVDAKLLAKLTERRFRADSARQRDAHGQGLGLSITAEICQRAGLALEFSTVEPRGLRATVQGEILVEPRGS